MTHYSTIPAALAALANGEISCVDLIQSHLDRLDSVNPQLELVLTRLDERALSQARRVDAKLARGDKLGPLEGIPYTAKDMFLVDGVRTTAASKILDAFEAPYTGTAIGKLEAAGAILIAKVNQDEFAHGGSTEYSGYAPSHNPRDLKHVPGGSSGGSAAAVAAGVGLFSLGTDTGGSIRQPAAYCGVVGIKPTYGLVSRFGVVSMASSLDVVGPLANTVEDATTVLEVIAGQDPHDATTIALADYNFHSTPASPRVGIIREYLEGLEPQVRQCYNATFEHLKSAGWRLEEVSVPHVAISLPAYYVITPSEISSNLERYDGVRYGSAVESAKDVEDAYSQTRGKYFGPEVQRRILTGTYTLSAGYYDAYYKKAMQIRTLIRDEFAAVFANYDVLIGPTTPTPAFAIGSNTADPVQMYLADIMTVAANLAGLPAISIPLAGPEYLPLGLQLMAAQGAEATLLGSAREAEEVLQTQLAELMI